VSGKHVEVWTGARLVTVLRKGGRQENGAGPKGIIRRERCMTLPAGGKRAKPRIQLAESAKLAEINPSSQR
jgi:hypothetical protein